MNRVFLATLAAAAVFLNGLLTQAATSWDQAPIWPKSLRLEILSSPDDRQVVAEATEIQWPAIVQKTDGQWLKISDPGTYTAAPVEGWLRKDDILRLDNVQSYCTNRIHAAEGQNRLNRGAVRNGGSVQKSEGLAEAYWIRGLFWETEGDIESAIADYSKAVDYGLASGDVYLRLARMQTQCSSKFEDQDFSGSMAICECADKSFTQAEKQFEKTRNGVPASFYVARGDAMSNRYSASGDLKYAKAALADYRKAEDNNASWSVPAYKQGKLRLTVLEEMAKKDANQKMDKATILAVIQDLTQAIRLNPNCQVAYEDRADALRRLTTATGETPDKLAFLVSNADGIELDRPASLHLPVNPPAGSVLSILEQANASADRAYLLSNNRGARALEVKAQVEFAIAQELYKPHNPALNLDKMARLDRAYSLYLDAIELAKDSANYSSTFNDIVGRFGMALNYYEKTNLVADDLSGRGANMVAANGAKIKSQLSTAEADLAKERESLEKIKSDDPERAQMLARADEAQQRINEARLALDASPKQLSPEMERTVRSKINDAGSALVHLGKATGSGNLAGGSIKPFRTAESHGTALLDTVEEAPAVARPPRPMYTPLNLDSK